MRAKWSYAILVAVVSGVDAVLTAGLFAPTGMDHNPVATWMAGFAGVGLLGYIALRVSAGLLVLALAYECNEEWIARLYVGAHALLGVYLVAVCLALLGVWS